MIYKLKATNAKAARREASKFQPTKPKNIRGFSKSGECVYIGLVRERGNKAPTATASKGDDKGNKAIRFEVEIEAPEANEYVLAQHVEGPSLSCTWCCWRNIYPGQEFVTYHRADSGYEVVDAACFNFGADEGCPGDFDFKVDREVLRVREADAGSTMRCWKCGKLGHRKSDCK